MRLPGREKIFGVIALAARLFLAGVFFYACLDKIQHPAEFAELVSGYNMLPEAVVPLVAVVLPWLELGLGVLLVLNRWPQGTVLLVNLLLIAFLIMLVSALVRGIDINCGCFSTDASAKANLLLDVVRDLVLLGMGCFIQWSAIRAE